MSFIRLVRFVVLGANGLLVSFLLAGCAANPGNRAEAIKAFQNRLATMPADEAHRLAEKTIAECKATEGKQLRCGEKAWALALRMFEIGDYPRGKEYALTAVKWPAWIKSYAMADARDVNYAYRGPIYWRLKEEARKQASAQEALSMYRLYLANMPLFSFKQFSNETVLSSSDRAMLETARLNAAAQQLATYDQKLVKPIVALYYDGNAACNASFVNSSVSGVGAIADNLRCQMRVLATLDAIAGQAQQALPRLGLTVPELGNGLAATRTALRDKAKDLQEQAAEYDSQVRFQNFTESLLTLGLSNLTSIPTIAPEQRMQLQTIQQYLETGK